MKCKLAECLTSMDILVYAFVLVEIFLMVKCWVHGIICLEKQWESCAGCFLKFGMFNHLFRFCFKVQTSYYPLDTLTNSSTLYTLSIVLHTLFSLCACVCARACVRVWTLYCICFVYTSIHLDYILLAACSTFSTHLFQTCAGYAIFSLLLFYFCWHDSIPLMQRIKILSDLLISVSKSERQEARMKMRQESLRLGNVGVIR